MNPETQQSESPYCVKIETETGQSATVPIAVLTPKQLEVFLTTEFKRLVQEAGVKGVRIHVERAIAADYEQVLRAVTACLSSELVLGAQPLSQPLASMSFDSSIGMTDWSQTEIISPPNHDSIECHNHCFLGQEGLVPSGFLADRLTDALHPFLRRSRS